MSEQLRELRGLNNISLDVAQFIMTECLHNLRDVEESHINRMALQSPHGVLNKERVILICRQKVCHSSNRVYRSPE